MDNFLEISAVLLSVLAVWLTTQRNKLCWPIGLVSVLLYAWIFWQAKLYSDTLLQLSFVVMQIYGWQNWATQNDASKEVAVIQIPLNIGVLGVAIGTLGSVVLGGVMSTMTDASLPWLDAALTSFSLVAQFWMARKYIACWWLWIIVDVIYVCVYGFKNLQLTAGLYVMLVILACLGLQRWTQALNAQKSGQLQAQ